MSRLTDSHLQAAELARAKRGCSRKHWRPSPRDKSLTSPTIHTGRCVMTTAVHTNTSAPTASAPKNCSHRVIALEFRQGCVILTDRTQIPRLLAVNHLSLNSYRDD
eukprot:815188-Rhodomonas_salina.1